MRLRAHLHSRRPPTHFQCGRCPLFHSRPGSVAGEGRAQTGDCHWCTPCVRRMQLLCWCGLRCWQRCPLSTLVSETLSAPSVRPPSVDTHPRPHLQLQIAEYRIRMDRHHLRYRAPCCSRNVCCLGQRCCQVSYAQTTCLHHHGRLVLWDSTAAFRTYRQLNMQRRRQSRDDCTHQTQQQH